MARLGELEVYEGIHELLFSLDAYDVEMGIVTKSPSMIPKKFVEMHNWPIRVVLGYHDAKKQKPDPESLLIALGGGGQDRKGDYHVGDQAEDTYAARAAGIIAIGATWGLLDKTPLEESKPDHLFSAVSDLEKFFTGVFLKGPVPSNFS